MIINFAQATLKTLPDGNIGMSISLSVNNHSISSETDLKTVAVDTTTLTAPQLQCLNDFIALLQSKLP